MAKIKFGMMMTDARGKLGGQVFSKNRSGAYVRTKVTPVNPRTVSQQANRALLGNLSSAWSGLTELERASWNSVTEAWQKTNVFGDLTKPTGKNLFTSLNKNAISAFPENELLVNPPAKAEFLPMSITSAPFNNVTGSLLVNLLGDGLTGSTYVVRATPGVSAGTSYVKNLFRRIGTSYVATETNQLNIGTSYVEVFGRPSAGQIAFIEVTPVAENGQLGVPVTFGMSITF